MKAWTYKQFKANQEAATQTRNNSSVWHKRHPAKVKASLWDWIKQLIRVYFPPKQADQEIDDLGFEELV